MKGIILASAGCYFKPRGMAQACVGTQQFKQRIGSGSQLNYGVLLFKQLGLVLSLQLMAVIQTHVYIKDSHPCTSTLIPLHSSFLFPLANIFLLSISLCPHFPFLSFSSSMPTFLCLPPHSCLLHLLQSLPFGFFSSLTIATRNLGQS